MDLRVLTENDKDQFNKLVTHIIQSWEWGEFRAKLGLTVLRYGIFDNDRLISAFQLTLHPIPFTKFNIGYLPKGPFPDKNLAEALIKIGREYNCVAIKIEPNIVIPGTTEKIDPRFKLSSKSLFTKHNFLIDLTKSEADLLKSMHPKTRYNIRIAQKNGVEVKEEHTEEAFQIYADLYFSTTKRQGYHGHSPIYHRLVWETLKSHQMVRFLIAYYSPPDSKNRVPLSAWMLVNFKDHLYYPYGGSSVEHKQVMANNLLAWEAIRLGKKLELKTFDLWGALGPDPDPNDSFIGFHRFKLGYGGKLVEYLGTYDLILNPLIYYPFTLIDKFTRLKVWLLKLLRR